MAMVKCRECNSDMSTSATACVKCGAKPSPAVSLRFVAGLLLFALLLYRCVMPSTERSSMAAESPLSEAATPLTSTPKASSVATSPTWRYEEKKDAMSGKSTKTASLDSENQISLDFPYSGANQPTLFIRKVGDSLDVAIQIDKGQILCHGRPCTIKVRFDDGKPVAFNGNGPSDSSAEAVFLSPEPKIVSQIKKSKTMLVEVVIFHQGTHVLKFNTAGLDW